MKRYAHLVFNSAAAGTVIYALLARIANPATDVSDVFILALALYGVATFIRGLVREKPEHVTLNIYENEGDSEPKAVMHLQRDHDSKSE